MFPHTITIYRLETINGVETITRQVVSGVYWYGSRAITASGNGAVETDAITIIASPETSQVYGETWTVRAKDRIVKGVGSTVTALKDITDCISVLSVEENVCGSTVDNITIVGR